MYRTQRRRSTPKQRRMPVLIKCFPQCRENKEQSSPGQIVFNTLLQCMGASKQESLKDKVLNIVCFISRSHHSGKPCSVSEQVSKSNVLFGGDIEDQIVSDFSHLAFIVRKHFCCCLVLIIWLFFLNTHLFC